MGKKLLNKNARFKCGNGNAVWFSPQNGDLKVKINGTEALLTDCRLSLVGSPRPGQCMLVPDPTTGAPGIKWITEAGDFPKTITDFFFNPIRLLSLQSRQSAAYKGIMALILKNHARDFISGAEMDFSTYSNEKIDIHHVFPKDYCIGKGYDKSKWNSIVNKTPISASSNREIGGVAPSAYLGKLEKKGSVMPSDLDGYIETHWIDHDLLRNNEFQNFIIDRAKKLLNAIELATGRTISGKDSDEVQQAFGDMLI